MSDRQRLVDAFYFKTGKCCAGCDWWRHINAHIGECTKSAPVAAHERYGMLGIHSPSINIGAGHIFTNRAHQCGDFKDTFDWATLPPHYLRAIGHGAGK